MFSTAINGVSSQRMTTFGGGVDGASGSISDSTDDHGDANEFWGRYESIKYADAMKTLLLEEVITKYGRLQYAFNELKETRGKELELSQSWRCLERARKEVNHLQGLLNRDPFMMVLIDGDGMIFHSKLLDLGDAGGRQAAAKLTQAIADWAMSNVLECPSSFRVVCRVYANVKGLGETCVRAGLVDSASKVEDFARGFTRGRPLFDFVDVGPGKDRADGKIAETFKLHLYDYQCRQILFGCSHDNGYARLLEQYIDDEGPLQRVTLLEGVPFEKELEILPFRKTKLPGMFRDTKINLGIYGDILQPRTDSRIGLNSNSSIFTPANIIGAPLINPQTGPAILNGSIITSRHQDLRQSTVSSTTPTPQPVLTTWASTAAKKAKAPLSDHTRSRSLLSDTTPAPLPVIKRNRKGQRLDEELAYNRDDVQRIKKLRSCNQHFIGMGCCHYNAGKADKCPHTHEHKLSDTDLQTLRVVARETPCKVGHLCDNPRCIYGHHCPFPPATEGSLRGSACLNGIGCRFPPSMHGMDMEAVKLKKVT